MNIAESIRTAFKSLIANKMRSALTMLGIVIGIAAVIALTSIGTGVQESITSQFESMGTNILTIRARASTSSSGVRDSFGSASTLTLEDSEAIATSENAPAILRVAPQMSTYSQIVSAESNINAQVIGTTPEYQLIYDLTISSGEFITEREIDARSRSCVLGSTIATTLFPDSDPVGQRVKLGTLQVTVVGVLEEQGGLSSVDDSVIIPLTTMQARMTLGRTTSGTHNVQSIIVQAISVDAMDAASEQVTAILRERHDILDPTGDSDDFSIINMADMLESLDEVMGILTVFLGLIAGISLIVGGIGIMNIMLVSVTERIREIGIRKAVGAKRRDILLQFLTESAILSLVGGFIGLLAGWLGSLLISNISISGQQIPAAISPNIVVLAMAISVAIGLFFGVYPANKASRLNPIEALRHE